MLKLNWERRSEHVDLDVEVAQRLIAPYSSQKIKDMGLMSVGCANTNYKVVLDNDEACILRFYVRDRDAYYRECALYALLKDKLPVPEIMYASDACDVVEYPYVIMSYMNGCLMRDVVVQGNHKAIGECAYSAGQHLGVLKDVLFEHGGFFGHAHDVIPFSEEESYLSYVSSCLGSDHVQEALGSEIIRDLAVFVEHHADCLPRQSPANLTHADFDPSNLLVKQINGTYQLAAILDWEFAFAGSYLFDMGLFLRYSHMLPKVYESMFVQGLVRSGSALPLNWKKSSKLSDMVSLLGVINQNTAVSRPNLIQDVISLLKHTMDHWGLF